MDDATRLATLEAELDDALTMRRELMARWKANGMPPMNMSMDGESYSWAENLSKVDEHIKELLAQRQILGGIPCVMSRARA